MRLAKLTLVKATDAFPHRSSRFRENLSEAEGFKLTLDGNLVSASLDGKEVLIPIANVVDMTPVRISAPKPSEPEPTPPEPAKAPATKVKSGPKRS